MYKKSLRTVLAVPLTALTVVTMTACSSAGESEESANWREATTLEEGGGMDALIEAAQAEGEFNTMGLYEDWANYGELLKVFGEKYDIKINNELQ